MNGAAWRAAFLTAGISALGGTVINVATNHLGDPVWWGAIAAVVTGSTVAARFAQPAVSGTTRVRRPWIIAAVVAAGLVLIAAGVVVARSWPQTRRLPAAKQPWIAIDVPEAGRPEIYHAISLGKDMAYAAHLDHGRVYVRAVELATAQTRWEAETGDVGNTCYLRIQLVANARLVVSCGPVSNDGGYTAVLHTTDGSMVWHAETLGSLEVHEDTGLVNNRFPDSTTGRTYGVDMRTGRRFPMHDTWYPGITWQERLTGDPSVRTNSYLYSVDDDDNLYRQHPGRADGTRLGRLADRIMISDDWTLYAAKKGMFEAYERDQLGKPLWSRPVPAGAPADIFGCTRTAICLMLDGGDLMAFDRATGSPQGSVHLPAVSHQTRGTTIVAADYDQGRAWIYDAVTLKQVGAFDGRFWFADASTIVKVDRLSAESPRPTSSPSDPTPPEFRFTAIDTVNGAARPLGTWNAELDSLAATYGRIGFFDGRRWVIQPTV